MTLLGGTIMFALSLTGMAALVLVLLAWVRAASWPAHGPGWQECDLDLPNATASSNPGWGDRTAGHG